MKVKRFSISSSVNRMLSSVGTLKRQKERSEPVDFQNEDEKEIEPYYSLENFNFDFNTRIARIEFLQSQDYRTIDRYVTINYVKYPEYSEWKTREKRIKKTIKLTNFELENLCNNDDELIRSFAEDIVIRINQIGVLMPSWFVEGCLKQLLEEDLDRIKKELDEFLSGKEEKKRISEGWIAREKAEIEELQIELKRLGAQQEKIQQKINWISSKKKSVFITILTLGIYGYLISEKRKNKFEKEAKLLSKSVKTIKDDIKSCKDIIATALNNIKDIEESIKDYKKQYYDRIAVRMDEYNEAVARVKPLDTAVNEDVSFIKLKDIFGLEYEKIIGCYIIHNIEKDKYYVMSPASGI